MPQNDVPPDKWAQLESTFLEPDTSSLLMTFATLGVGCVLALYVQFLFRHSKSNVAHSSTARVFPLLTIITISIITVVKSSLALSLGLVGALSIVRFRAAIKDPEELVYLFLCIGIGLSLGAAQFWPAVALVVFATLFVFTFGRLKQKTGSAFLTIIGEKSRCLEDVEGTMAAIRNYFPNFTVERWEIDGVDGQIRVHLNRIDSQRAPQLVAKLQQELEGCTVSYINSDSLP